MERTVERLSYFLVVLQLMFYGEIFGQKFSPENGRITDSNTISPRFIPGNDRNYRPVSRHFWRVQEFSNPRGSLRVGQAHQSFNTDKVSLAVRPSLAIDHAGFICRKEWQLDKITVIPFRFRLGSLAYVNYLERKPNADRH